MRVRADGTGAVEPLVAVEKVLGGKVATSWSADGRLLAFNSSQDVVVRDAEGVFHPSLTTKAVEQDARFAPSGQWFSYSSNETGRFEIYVQSYPPGSGKWQISNGGGTQAMWSANGRELFFKNGNRMMAVDVELGATFKASTPRALFEMPMPDRDLVTPARYAVTPDAQRFLVLTTAEGASEAAATPQMTVVLNYAQALKR